MVANHSERLLRNKGLCGIICIDVEGIISQPNQNKWRRKYEKSNEKLSQTTTGYDQ
jgi:hypothetical protein